MGKNRTDLEHELAFAKAELAETKKQLNNKVAELNETKKQLNDAEADLAMVRNELAKVKDLSVEQQREIENLRNTFDDLRSKLASMLLPLR